MALSGLEHSGNSRTSDNTSLSVILIEFQVENIMKIRKKNYSIHVSERQKREGRNEKKTGRFKNNLSEGW